MAQAIALLFDSGANSAVRAVWAALEEAGVPSLFSFTHRRHQPHVSLLVAERITPGDWVATVGQLVGSGDSQVELSASCAFPGPGGYVFLAATATRGLLMAHQQLVAAVRDNAQGIWEHYLPDAWVPHCTLAGGLSDSQIAEAVRIGRIALTISATVRAVALIDSQTGETRIMLDADAAES